MSQSKAAGGHAMAAARNLNGASRYTAYAAGQAVVVAHVAHMNWVQQPMQLRQCAKQHLIVVLKNMIALSANGNVRNFQLRYVT